MTGPTTILPPTKKEKKTLRFMIVLGCLSILYFGYAFFAIDKIGNGLLYTLLCLTLIYSLARILYEWYHYWDISAPLEKTTTKHYTVDILTTYFPGEPYAMIENTLLAIKNIRYPHTTILCDEANDPRLIAFCKTHNIRHISRNVRIDAKAGNINNALRKVAKGEICVILDPDHVPSPEFLDHVIPYFDDKEIGFVQIVQAYNNIHESYVAKGSAQQTFQFYGPIMMCMNSYGTVNAIGANCTFRRVALDSIQGHAAGLSEDMHTAMQLHAKGWKSIYVPKVLARGLVPSSLTAYYKQQLKWARGTTDLLAHVYPKLFKNFTWRQRIHYGLIPLHYIIGFFYLINFLIPIIALCFSITPWKGNILQFGLSLLPLLATVIIIRNYVQRWVMEEKERGFHAVGGLLQISSWWVFCLGCLYTVIGKKIPYLPTPKTGEDKTSWKLLAPNIVIGVFSLTSIVYGLDKNLTPFSLFMAGFAFLNAFFMFFTIYLGFHKSKQLGAIKNNFSKKAYQTNLNVKIRLWRLRHTVYSFVRTAGLPILIIIIGFSIISFNCQKYKKWDGVSSSIKPAHLSQYYLGIYSPLHNNGLSNSEVVKQAEENLQIAFDINAHYIPWGDTQHFDNLKKVLEQKSYNPLISWEPWSNDFSFSNQVMDLRENKQIFKHILKGEFDNYIKQTAFAIKAYNQTVYLRFAHEFDNPFYPWSQSGNNTPEEFKKAWVYIWKLFKELEVNNVKWVWNPWKPEAVSPYYPGDTYVDYIGLTALNYGGSESFDQLYGPFKKALRSQHINKPVILAEFGSLKSKTNQTSWITQAIENIQIKYPEIKHMVFFNTALDQNVPPQINSSILNWKINEYDKIRETLWASEFEADQCMPMDSVGIRIGTHQTNNNQITQNIKGVVYNKGINWYENYFTLDIRTLKEDFGQIKKLGFNNIKYFGSTIYNHNVFKTAKLFDLNIDYGFWIPNLNDFKNNAEAVVLENEILKTVQQLKDQTTIDSWHISNDILSHNSTQYKAERVLEKQESYSRWIHDLSIKIKAEDASRPIVLSLDLNKHSIKHTALLLSESPPIDAIALNILEAKDSCYLKEFASFASKQNIAFMLGAVNPNELEQISKFFSAQKSIYIANWQDSHHSTSMSLDGIIDFQYAHKPEYQMVKSYFKQQEFIPVDQKITILQPAARLKPGFPYRYTAVFKSSKNDPWDYNIPNPKHSRIEWFLLKCDVYGNPLVMKSLSDQPHITLRIPADYSNYRLMLKYYHKNSVLTTIKALNTHTTSGVSDNNFESL